MKEIKYDANIWKHILCSRLQDSILTQMTNTQNDYTTQSNLEIQCNLYQITNGIFHKTRTKNFKICMEAQKTSNSQSNPEEETELEGSGFLTSDYTPVRPRIWAFVPRRKNRTNKPAQQMQHARGFIVGCATG